MIVLKIVFVLLIFIPVLLLAVSLSLELLRNIPKEEIAMEAYEKKLKRAKEKGSSVLHKKIINTKTASKNDKGK